MGCHQGIDFAVAGSRRSPGRSPTAILQPSPAQYDDATLAAAFRDLHGPRLHGFAILVTLGDQQLAERVAGFSLAAGARQAAALRHPERAAAWLRARTLRALHEPRAPGRSTPVEARRAALATLGVDESVYHGLAALGIDARAALVASAIERFDPIDVETILAAAPAATRHAVAEARSRYMRFAVKGSGEEAGPAPDEPIGELAARVQEVSARAFSTGDEPR
ncbi:MAG TPA: hypothetical protein VGQ66_00390 [Candidatus Limnocylindria bacterium]|jgi:hypothetical protein|nr:hypothetical protein [Candidatus Limnocylindria bacterium]